MKTPTAPTNEIELVPDNQQVDFYNIVTTYIQTDTVIPTYVPKKLIEQIVIIYTGGLHYLYIYDTKNNVWKYTQLT